MARSDLTLNVGTKYHDEGLKKLGGAMKNTTKTVADASRVVGSLSSELKGVTGQAGRAAGAIGGLFQSLMAGGPIALVITGLTTAVSFLAKAFGDAKDKAKEAAEVIGNRMVNAVKTLVASYDTLIDKIKTAQSRQADFEKVYKESDDVDVRIRRANISQKGEKERKNLDPKSAAYRMSKAREERDLAMDRENENFKPWQRTVMDKDGAMKTQKQLEADKAYEAQKNIVDALKKAREELLKKQNNNEFSEGGREWHIIKNKVDELEKQYKSAPATKQQKLFEQWNEAQTVLTKYENGGKSLLDYSGWANWANLLPGVETHENLGKIYIDTKKEIDAALEKYDKEIEDATHQQMLALERKSTADKAVEAAEKEHALAVKRITDKYKEQETALEEERQKREADVKKAGKKLGEAGVKLWGNKRKADEAAEAKEIKTIKAGRELGEKLATFAKTIIGGNKEHEKEKDAAKQLAEAEKQRAEILAQWNANPNQNFNAWNAGQQGAQRDADKAAARRQRNIQQAQDQANAVGGRIFNKDGSLRRGANAFDVGRFAELSDYLGFENVKDDKGRMDAMRGMRDKLQNKLFNKDGTLKKGVNPLGRDVGLFKKLDGSLKKFDAANKPKGKPPAEKIFDLLKQTLPKLGI